MEAEVLLPCSQKRSIGPYPEPTHYPISVRSILGLLIPYLGISGGLIPSVFPYKIKYAFLFSNLL
jgi:hypothetical protein